MNHQSSRASEFEQSKRQGTDVGCGSGTNCSGGEGTMGEDQG